MLKEYTKVQLHTVRCFERRRWAARRCDALLQEVTGTVRLDLLDGEACRRVQAAMREKRKRARSRR